MSIFQIHTYTHTHTHTHKTNHIRTNTDPHTDITPC